MMRLIIAVALVAVGARTAYYFYVTKKPKGCLDPEKFNEFKLIKRSSHLLSLLQLQSWAFQLDNILVAEEEMILVKRLSNHILRQLWIQILDILNLL